MKNILPFVVAVIALFFVTACIVYPYMPSLVASHWNIHGEVNGMVPRAWGVFGLAAIFSFVIALIAWLPRLDPHRDAILKFEMPFRHFVACLVLILYYFYFLTIVWSLGYRFDFTAFLMAGLALLFYAIGILLPQTMLNFTIGIRTPWTIASPEVWAKTHRLGGALFKISAVIIFLGACFPAAALWFLFIPLVVIIIWLFVYSYRLYARERH